MLEVAHYPLSASDILQTLSRQTGLGYTSRETLAGAGTRHDPVTQTPPANALTTELALSTPVINKDLHR